MDEAKPSELKRTKEEEPFPLILLLLFVRCSAFLLFSTDQSPKTLSARFVFFFSTANERTNVEWVININFCSILAIWCSSRTLAVQSTATHFTTAISAFNFNGGARRRYPILFPFWDGRAATFGCAKIIYTTLLLRHIKHTTPHAHFILCAHPRRHISIRSRFAQTVTVAVLCFYVIIASLLDTHTHTAHSTHSSWAHFGAAAFTFSLTILVTAASATMVAASTTTTSSFSLFWTQNKLQ